MQEQISASAAPVAAEVPLSTPTITPLSADAQCPTCHVTVRSTDYFCFNCGHNLKPKPLSTSVLKQFLLYSGSILLPPFGLVWGWPYLKESTTKAKMIGVVTIFLTLVSLLGSTYYAFQFAQNINQQVNDQMSRLQGLE
ncbi:MAG: hypothetical protein ABI425_02235 [Patescibacteria group bacterium]